MWWVRESQDLESRGTEGHLERGVETMEESRSRGIGEGILDRRG